MSKNLNSAKDRIRKANSPSDYKAVIGDIKTSLDSIKNLQTSPTNAREFLVDSKTFIDIDHKNTDIAKRIGTTKRGWGQ
jgi:hypothetical protein